MNCKMLVAKIVMIVFAAFCWGWALSGVTNKHILQFTIGSALTISWCLLALLWRERRRDLPTTYIEYIGNRGNKVIFPTDEIPGPVIEKLKRERCGVIITDEDLDERRKQRTSEIRKLESWLGLK